MSVHQAETVNIYITITIANGDEDASPPLITVQGR